MDNPYEPPKPHDDPLREPKAVPPSMPWTEAIRVALLMFVFAIIAMFCVVSLGMTWDNAKGGASGIYLQC